MPDASSVLSLIARLRARSRQARRLGSATHAEDLRYACFLLQRFASLLVMQEAVRTTDEMRAAQLRAEARALWPECKQ